MRTSRRGVLGLAAAGFAAGALAGEAGAQPLPSSLAVRRPGRDYGAALAKLRDYAAAELAAVGQLGMTLAIADADGFAATMTLGWADVAAKVPVRSDHLFEVGSISKSITALCLHSLAEEGKVDLDAPISRYLESVPLPETPIALSQLLNHAGGLSHDAPVFPNTPDGRLWSGFKPGSRFSYSNIGYLLLGLVIEKVTGRPHPEVIQKRVLAPLGMTGAHAHLRVGDRARYATGYVPFDEGGPVLVQLGMVPGPFEEGDYASGAVAASAEAMLGYLDYVLALGRGKGGQLMSDARARALLAADIENDEFGPHSRYASGFATVQIDDRPALHHTGGMVLFTSSFHVDPAAGVACFASVNGRIGPYRPRKTTAYAVRLMRAVREGKPLPDLPDPLDYRRAEKPEPMLGRWFGSDGRVLDLVAAPGGLKLVADGKEGRIEKEGDKGLATDHPAYARHLLQFEIENDRAASLWWGETLFGRDRAPAQPAPDPALVPLSGWYSQGSAWTGGAVLVRGSALHLESAGELVKRPGGYWSPREEEGEVTRLWFTKFVNGRAYQLSFCGDILVRLS